MYLTKKFVIIRDSQYVIVKTSPLEIPLWLKSNKSIKLFSQWLHKKAIWGKLNGLDGRGKLYLNSGISKVKQNYLTKSLLL